MTCTPANPCHAAGCIFCDPAGSSGANGHQPEPDLLDGLRDGTWLNQQTFPPLRYAVPGLIPEGFGLLVGPPKAGKSWLALALLLAIASGGTALGALDIEQPRRVLYLGLEDGDRRMQDRCRSLLGHLDPIPPLFTYLTQVEPKAILPTIEAYLERYPDTALVVIDTLGKVMPQAMPQETTYQRDYRVGGKLKAVADSRPGLAVLVLHHDRKAGAEDFVERVSGTNGLTGAADTVMVLARKRQSADGLLSVTGRDVPEGEYALTLPGGGGWALDGADLDQAADRARQRQEEGSLSDTSTEVLAAVRDAGQPVRAGELVGRFGNKVYEYLRRHVEAGRLEKVGRGQYAPVGGVRSVRSEDEEPSDSHTPHTSNNPTLRLAPSSERCGCGETLIHHASIKRGQCERCRLDELQAEAGP